MPQHPDEDLLEIARMNFVFAVEEWARHREEILHFRRVVGVIREQLVGSDVLTDKIRQTLDYTDLALEEPRGQSL